MKEDTRYIFVRYGDFLIPLLQSTVEALIREKMNELWKVAGLPEIPVRFQDEPPVETPRAIANFWNRGKRADRIEFYVSKLHGMGLADMYDTAGHEVAHYIQFSKNGVSDHSEGWKAICLETGICRPYATKRVEHPRRIPDLQRKELIESKRALLDGKSADAWDAAIEETWAGSNESIRVTAFLAMNNSHLSAILKRLAAMASRGDDKAMFLHAYIKLVLEEDEEKELIPQLQEAAEKGNVLANYYVGKWLLEGRFFRKHLRKGIAYIAKSAFYHFEPAMFLFQKTFSNHPDFALMDKALTLELKKFDPAEELLPDRKYSSYIPYL